MTEWARALIEDFGYGGIALLMLVENVFPPIPSEAVLPLAGYTTTRGELALPLVVVAATVGSVVGALAFYWAGLALGEERLQSVVARHGGWITLTTDDLERGRRWFERHGGKAVLACRLVPGLRSVISRRAWPAVRMRSHPARSGSTSSPTTRPDGMRGRLR